MRYWQKGVTGDYIDQDMSDKSSGATETFVQVLNGIWFYTHCTCKHNYITKIIWNPGSSNLAVGWQNLDDVQICRAIQLSQLCQALGGWCEQLPSWSNWIRGDLGNKMVAKQPIYIPLTSSRGWCGASSGPWKERGAEATLHFWKQLAKCMIFNLGNNRIATFPIHPNMSRKGSWLGRKNRTRQREQLFSSESGMKQLRVTKH